MITDGFIYNSPEVYMGYSYTSCQRSEHLIYNGLKCTKASRTGPMLSTALNYDPAAVCTFRPRARSRLRSWSLSRKTDLEVDCRVCTIQMRGSQKQSQSLSFCMKRQLTVWWKRNTRTSPSAAPATLGEHALKIPAL